MTIRLMFLLTMVGNDCFSQSITLDSCGLNNQAKLNAFEIAYLDQVLFADSVFDFKKGFKFDNKRLAFFICNQQISPDGFITKSTFFEMIKANGHQRPRGLSVLNQSQQEEVGFDAIVLIDCKLFNDQELISRLQRRKEEQTLFLLDEVN